MKKSKIVLSILMSCVLCACSANEPAGSKDEKIRIVTTVFPAYDWCREIIGDNPGDIDLSFLMNSGSDLHSFQPSADDIMKIAEADLFVYVGGESDEWVKDALKQTVNPDSKALSLMEILNQLVKEEEIVEGMEADHEEEHDHEETEYDEHVWLSLRNAEAACANLAQYISEIDPEHADVYSENVQNYVAALSGLDGEYIDTVANAETKTLLFADRFPFRYLTDDYNLEYYAAFAGCSAETEASFETVIFLADKTDELSLKHVMCIEGSDEKIAKTVIENTVSKNQNILHLDSMQSTTLQDVNAGTTYLSIMEKNLEILKEALN